MTTLQILSFFLTLGAAIGGGFYPLAHRDTARGEAGFPNGEAFAAGVYLALSLVIMMPAGFHLFDKALPHSAFPLAPLVAIIAFLSLLAIEHAARRRMALAREGEETDLSPPSIPIIMTVMIALPSFLLGTALGISEATAAIFILIAVMAHKSSAGFGLALSMVRSTLTRRQTFLLYAMFAFATPVGILAGVDARQLLSGETVLFVKAVTLSLASGVFLYMATVHEFQHAPLIRHCASPSCFRLMLLGLLLTFAVRIVLGLGHVG